MHRPADRRLLRRKELERWTYDSFVVAIVEDAKGAFDAKMSWLLGTFQSFKLDAIIAELHLLLYRHGEFFFQAIRHGPGNAHKDQYDAEVNDKPAVAR